MKKINYTIAKKADKSTEFIIEKIIDLDERFAKFFIRLSKETATTTFADLNEHDLLIKKEDWGKGEKDNILEINEIIKKEDDLTVLKVSKLSKTFDGSTGYSVDDRVLFLARAEFI